MDNSAFSSMLGVSVAFGFLGGLCFYSVLGEFIDFVVKKIIKINETLNKTKKVD